MFRRESDGKIFHITFHSHWSDIRAEDGETDYVKCYGFSGDEEWYVSANKGHKYIKVEK